MNPSAPRTTIRPATSADAAPISHLFYDTVHEVNCRDYSPEQLNAWAPERDRADFFRNRQRDRLVYVAETEQQITGFAELDLTTNPARIDCFYVNKDSQRCGVGQMLWQKIKQEAINRNIHTLHAEVSITARPFFQRQQFAVLREQQVERRAILFTNYLMEWTFDPG